MPLLFIYSRLAIVTRFLRRMVLKRRRTRAVKIMVGALSAFTNSNAVGRYARRVNWGARHLQAVTRRRMACMSSHLILLNRHWDKRYPPAPLLSAKKAVVPLQSPPSSSAATASPSAADAQLAASASPSSSKRPARKKGGVGQGGQRKGKGRQKRQQSVAGAGRKRESAGGNRGGTRRSKARPAVSVAADDNGTELAQADQRRRPPVYVCPKAKHEEVLAWLRRTRSKNSRDVMNYERFTVRPVCLTEPFHTKTCGF